MPAHAVDPDISERRQHPAVESTAHHHAGEQREDELEPVHRAAAALTARTYPVGGPDTHGVDRTSAPSCPKRADGGPRFPFGRLGHAFGSPATGTRRGEVPGMARTTRRDVMRERHRRFNGDHDKVVAAHAAET